MPHTYTPYSLKIEIFDKKNYFKTLPFIMTPPFFSNLSHRLEENDSQNWIIETIWLTLCCVLGKGCLLCWCDLQLEMAEGNELGIVY